MIVPCRTIEQLLRNALAYPRRVELTEDQNAIVFKADDGTRIYIAKVDFERCSESNDIPFRTKFFLQAIGSEKGKADYCDSLNYGKPDWKS